jgi:hypothetical protein
VCRSFEAVGRMAQEDHAQHRHKIIAGCQLGVGTEVVRRLPEVSFEFFDVLRRCQSYYSSFLLPSELTLCPKETLLSPDKL